MNKNTTPNRFAVFTLLMTLFSFATVFAQPTDSVEMADALRTNGKIYVVVTVLSVIFTGIAIYLIRIDRRISRMEKEKRD